MKKVKRLSGPGLDTEDVPGVMQGGGKWPERYVFNSLPTGNWVILYSETCLNMLKRPLKNRQNKVFKLCAILMQVKVLQNAPREHSAVLLTCIKRVLVLKTYCFGLS